MSLGRPAAGVLLGGWPAFAAAHGFGQRFDLPLPLWLWVTGAGATIVLTFGVTAVFLRERRLRADYPRLNLLRVAPNCWVAHPAVVGSIRVVGVILFVLTACTGLFGVQDPTSIEGADGGELAVDVPQAHRLTIVRPVRPAQGS